METESYFQRLNKSLTEYHRSIPFALIDLDILDKNLKQLRKDLNPEMAFRIVVKSLPSIDLLTYIMDKTGTKKLMVFHQPFLSQISSKSGRDVDILLGKPMPIKTAEYFFDNFQRDESEFNPSSQIQWLVDTEKRIHQYINLASSLGLKLRLNLEIDVGLHRGGFQDLGELRSALNLIKTNSDKVELSGFMGYDPHIVKIPSFIQAISKSLKASQDFYRECILLLKSDFPELWNSNLTFNGAGSPTLNLHHSSDSVLNDISAGSCLLKPTTFDIPSLTDYDPACFIATPVLKKLDGTSLPALEKMKGLLNLLSSKNRTSYFIYGGFWKADFCYPAGTQVNKIFGPTTNQSMINTSPKSQLAVDDFVFLRPHQSEFVLLQFGRILTIKDARITGAWLPLENI